MKRVAFVLLTIATGCSNAQYVPAPTPVARPAAAVSASFDRTWDAVIDAFALQSIPISTIEKASGLIVASTQRVTESDGKAWGDCGTTKGYYDKPLLFYPDRAEFNVVVRKQDEATTTVRVTSRWTHPITDRDRVGLTLPTVLSCSSTGSWESGFEQSIKAAAEKR